jgi:hypothetical protein
LNQLPQFIMAAKKTAKKSPESASPKEAAAPAPKKVAKKAPAKKAAKSTTPPPKAAAPKVTTEAIARAAYLNYRRRVEQGLPGDRESDWLEAERQLLNG